MTDKATTALDQKLFADLQLTDEVLGNDYAADGVTVVGTCRIPLGDLLRKGIVPLDAPLATVNSANTVSVAGPMLGYTTDSVLVVRFSTTAGTNGWTSITDALKPGDNISELTNDAGYQDAADVAASITAAINNLLAGAPGALDTLNELAAALGDDPDFAGTITAAVAAKEPAQTPASQAEAEAGTVTEIRSWSPLRVKQAINAIGQAFADAAQASADAAAASASAASTSETNAATSETNAAASASAASTSETNAAASEAAASTSETNAAASETAAASSQSAAAASASAASTSEVNAGTSETNAAASAAAAAASAAAADVPDVFSSGPDEGSFAVYDGTDWSAVPLTSVSRVANVQRSVDSGLSGLGTLYAISDEEALANFILAASQKSWFSDLVYFAPLLGADLSAARVAAIAKLGNANLSLVGSIASGQYTPSTGIDLDGTDDYLNPNIILQEGMTIFAFTSGGFSGTLTPYGTSSNSTSKRFGWKPAVSEYDWANSANQSVSSSLIGGQDFAWAIQSGAHVFFSDNSSATGTATGTAINGTTDLLHFGKDEFNSGDRYGGEMHCVGVFDKKLSSAEWVEFRTLVVNKILTPLGRR